MSGNKEESWRLRLDTPTDRAIQVRNKVTVINIHLTFPSDTTRRELLPAHSSVYFDANGTSAAAIALDDDVILISDARLTTHFDTSGRVTSHSSYIYHQLAPSSRRRSSSSCVLCARICEQRVAESAGIKR